MPLELRYEFTNNANLTSVGSNGVRFGEVALSQSAEVGQPDASTLEFDDDAAALDFVGWRQFLATETAAASNSQLIGKFRLGARSYSRGDSQRTTVARRMKVDLLDYNAQLGLRIFTDASANRPAETASDRLTWVLTTAPNTLYRHPTLCTAPATAMDAADYRQQRYNDVLADIANLVGYNFWCAFDEGRSRSEIFFMDPGSTDYASTIAISNDLSAIDSSTVFAMSEDTELRRDPSRITSGALVAYANGWVYENRFSTADNFEFIDQTAPLANVKTATKARVIANRYLSDNDEEDDRINTSIIVPAAQVNDIRQGHRIVFTATHLPGYEAGRYVRVLRRTVIQEAALGLNYYRIALELSGPGSVIEPPAPELIYSGTITIPGDSGYIFDDIGASGWENDTLYGWSITGERASGPDSGYAWGWLIGFEENSLSAAAYFDDGNWAGFAANTIDAPGTEPGTTALPWARTGTFTTNDAGHFNAANHLYFACANANSVHGASTWTWTWSVWKIA